VEKTIVINNGYRKPYFGEKGIFSSEALQFDHRQKVSIFHDKYLLISYICIMGKFLDEKCFAKTH
jgi:hypothetical protein